MPTVLAFMAHPDDAEFLCAGLFTLLRQAGWDVHVATMTPGDLGSATLSSEEIARVRRGEAAASAALLEASYTCLECRDLTVVYGEETKRPASALLREVRPDLLVTLHPSDYMEDHTETARIVREAAFASTIRNWKIVLPDGRELPPCDHLPTVLYADPVDNVDHFGARVTPTYVVDITDVIDLKEQMLACHDSQRAWLREQHGEDEYLLWMRRTARDRARDFGKKRVKYAEGFTQHRGNAFPREDPLTKVLGRRRVKTVREQ